MCCVWPDEGATCTFTDVVAHGGGGSMHDGYRHVQILLCMDILKDEGVSKINRYNDFGYMQCLLKAC